MDDETRDCAVRWANSLRLTFPAGIPAHASCGGAGPVNTMLRHIARNNCARIFLPGGGIQQLRDLRRSPFDMCALEWRLGGPQGISAVDAVTMVWPERIAFHCPAHKPRLAYFMLQVGPMDFGGDPDHPMREDVAQRWDGTFQPLDEMQERAIFEGIPFPHGTRRVTRYVRPATFIICSRVSDYNEVDLPGAAADTAPPDEYARLLARLRSTRSS